MMKMKIATLAFCATLVAAATEVVGLAAPVEKLPPLPISRPDLTRKSATECGHSEHDVKAAGAGALIGCVAGALCTASLLTADGAACFLSLCGAVGGLAAIAGDEIADAIDGVTQCAGIGVTYKDKRGAARVHYFFNHDHHDHAVRAAEKWVRQQGGGEMQVAVRFDSESRSCGANVWNGTRSYFGYGATSTEAHHHANRYCKENSGGPCSFGAVACNSWNE